jgi:FMN phosphatase YigB (HAD superfamily)
MPGARLGNWTPALIFDFGNVVAHFDYGRACAALASRWGRSAEELRDRFGSAEGRRLAQLYECGRMTAETFAQAFCRQAGFAIEHEEFVRAWCDIFWLNEPVAALVAALKSKGYTLVLGSNTNDLHAAQFRRQFAETLAHFDRLVLSYEIGHIKPSAAFYLACVEAAAAVPEACVFIDDLPENVAGARAVGLDGLVYRDPPSLIAELRRRGVEVPEG